MKLFSCFNYSEKTIHVFLESFNRTVLSSKHKMQQQSLNGSKTDFKILQITYKVQLFWPRAASEIFILL